MTPKMSNRRSERGNVFTILIAAIGLAGILGVATYNLMSGPYASIARISGVNMTKYDMLAASKIAMMYPNGQTNAGDCDIDGYIEPPAYTSVGATLAPMGGGQFPHSVINAPVYKDAWGTTFGYCVWDIGTTGNPCAANMLQGTPDPTTGETQSQTVMALVSAGPDRKFNTTCSAYVDGTTPLIISTATTTDDVVMKFTYAEAAQATSSLWKMKLNDASTITIDKNVSIGSGINIDKTSGLGSFLAVNSDGKVSVADDAIIGEGIGAACNSGNIGLMRYSPLGGGSSDTFTSSTIGPITQSGSYGEASGTHTLSVESGDIWDASDSFRFAYREITGDTAIVARVASHVAASGGVGMWSKSGVMVRDSLAPDSNYMYALLSGGNGTRGQFRSSPSSGGDSFDSTGSQATANSYTPPTWVRVVRTGSVMVVSDSPDGIVWTDLESQVIPTTGTVFVGLALASNQADLNTATFDNVSVTPSGIAGDPGIEICTNTGWEVAGVPAAPATGTLGPRFGGVTSATTDGGSLTIPAPSGLETGDLIVLQISSDMYVSGTITFPAGFTPVVEGQSVGSDEHKWAVAYKVSDGTETSFIISATDSFEIAGTAARYSGIDAANPITVSSTNKGADVDTATDADGIVPLDTTSITTTADNALIVFFGGVDTHEPASWGYIYSCTPPSGFTERADFMYGYTNMCFAEKRQATAGATGVISGQGTGGTPYGYGVRAPNAIAYAINAGNSGSTTEIQMVDGLWTGNPANTFIAPTTLTQDISIGSASLFKSDSSGNTLSLVSDSGKDMLIALNKNCGDYCVPSLNMLRSRGTEVARTNTLAGDRLSRINFNAYVNGDFRTTARIESTALGNSNIKTPTRVDFMTMNNAGVLQPSMRFNTNSGLQAQTYAGLGVTTPAEALHVAGAPAQMMLETFNSNADEGAVFATRRTKGGLNDTKRAVDIGDVVQSIDFIGRDTDSYETVARIRDVVTATPTLNDLRRAWVFSTGTNSASLTERMRIDSNGYLGINKNNPATRFDLNGIFLSGIAGATSTDSRGATGAGKRMMFDAAGQSFYCCETTGATWDYSPPESKAGSVILGTDSNSTVPNGLVIGSNSQVGRPLASVFGYFNNGNGLVIGAFNNAPSTSGAKVTIGNSVNNLGSNWLCIGNNLSCGSNNDGLAGFVMGSYASATGNNASAIGLASSGNFTNSTPNYLQIDGGNWMIGTTTGSTGYELYVNGTAGMPGGGAWTMPSDARLKNIDGAYTKGLAEIAKLEPVRFHYKKDNALGLPSSPALNGFIAQDVQKIFPEAISTDEKGYLAFNMHPLTIAMVNGLRELNDQNKSMADKNAQWRAKNAKTKASLDKLAADIAQLKATPVRTSSLSTRFAIALPVIGIFFAGGIIWRRRKKGSKS